MSADRIKCLVWDLDDTLWRGTLLEGDDVVLYPGACETLKELDRRGILHSVASQGDRVLASAALERAGILPYFLHPQIGLESEKPEQIRLIAERLGLSLEHLAFIDDSPFQRAYVEDALPELTVLEASRLPDLISMDLFDVGRATAEATRRRERYLDGERRGEAERSWSGHVDSETKGATRAPLTAPNPESRIPNPDSRPPTPALSNTEIRPPALGPSPVVGAIRGTAR